MVTGATSGIGEACALRFAKEGYDVIITGRRDHLLQALAKRIEALGVRAKTLCFDVRDQQQVFDVCGSLEADWAEIDVLINNAGIADYDLINVITPARWRRLFAVNVDGAFYCIRAALPHMLQQQSGCIINVSSMWGQIGASCEAAYSATKGAILALTKALAQELGPSGIRVNCVAPGVIDTDMVQVLGPEVLHDLAEQTPLGRLGTPQDIANAVAFLASEKASFITGQVLGVDGGYI